MTPRERAALIAAGGTLDDCLNIDCRKCPGWGGSGLISCEDGARKWLEEMAGGKPKYVPQELGL
jgi:hypothetical protein